MKKSVWFLLALCVGMFGFENLYAQKNYVLTSPDNKIELLVDISNHISWKVKKRGKILLSKVMIDMTIDGKPLSDYLRLKSHRTTIKDEPFSLVVPTRDRYIDNKYKELRLEFYGFSVDFRVYDNSVAYRFGISKSRNVEIQEEKMEVLFPEETSSFFPKEESMYSHYERSYLKTSLDSLPLSSFASLPILFLEKNGNRMLFSEADVYDYPHMFLMLKQPNLLVAKFPKSIMDYTPTSDRKIEITKEFSHIAKTSGNRSFPWRFFVVSDNDAGLVQQNTVIQLSRPPSATEDFSWVKTGKVAWDWWNSNNIHNVDFKSGINTKTYKYYIDFANKYGLEYLMIDEGWSKTTTNILETDPNVDVQEIVNYGKSKNVGVILWCLWHPLDSNMDKILDQYARWGVKGVKVDFMQRADQYMVNFYERLAKACAKRKLVVDFHGAFKPAGLRKAFPNVLSYEGVRGNEWNKFSQGLMVDHNLTIPFIRMAVGPMDYTPGAMHNVQDKNFAMLYDRPMSRGTRAHQVAMYVVYESGLQMLCDNPTSYLEDKKTIDFISQIPTTWEQTKVLSANVGSYLAIARRNQNKWYVGALNATQYRHLDIDFSFLPDGKYDALIFKDGVNVDRYAEDYVVERMQVDRTSKINIELTRGGGWTAIIRKAQ